MSDNNSNQTNKQELKSYDDYKEGFFDSYKTSRLMTNIDVKSNISTLNNGSKEDVLEYIEGVLHDVLSDEDLAEFKMGVSELLGTQHKGIDSIVSNILDSASEREDSALNHIEFLRSKITLLLSQIESNAKEVVEKRSEYYQLEVSESNRVSEGIVSNVKFTGEFINNLFKFTLIFLAILFAPSFFALVVSGTASAIQYLDTDSVVYLYWFLFFFSMSLLSVFILFVGTTKLLKKHERFLSLVGSSSAEELRQTSSSAVNRVDKVDELVNVLKNTGD